MKITYLVLIILVAASCAQVNQDSAREIGVGFIAGGQEYQLEITQAQLSDSPSWLESRDNPPLAPGKALRIARAHLNSVVPDAKAWSLENIIIMPVGGGKSVYIIEFQEPIPLEFSTGVWDIYKVMVLMDGSVGKAKMRPLGGKL